MDVSGAAFERQYRTASSEGYNVLVGTTRVARLDLHFTLQSVYATLVLLEELSAADLPKLIQQIDERLVLSAETTRDDFFVTVFRGQEVGFFSDDFEAADGRRARIRPGSRLAAVDDNAGEEEDRA